MVERTSPVIVSRFDNDPLGMLDEVNAETQVVVKETKVILEDNTKMLNKTQSEITTIHNILNNVQLQIKESWNM